MNQNKNKTIKENIKLIILAGGKGTRLSEKRTLSQNQW